MDIGVGVIDWGSPRSKELLRKLEKDHTYLCFVHDNSLPNKLKQLKLLTKFLAVEGQLIVQYFLLLLASEYKMFAIPERVGGAPSPGPETRRIEDGTRIVPFVG